VYVNFDSYTAIHRDRSISITPLLNSHAKNAPYVIGLDGRLIRGSHFENNLAPKALIKIDVNSVSKHIVTDK